MDKSLSIHQKNLQIFAREIYRTKIDSGPESMKDIFHFIQKLYNLRNDPELQRRRIWELILKDIRNANSLGIF